MASKTIINTGDEAEKKYKAPALEKGLDILELLARNREPLTTSQIANKLDRSVSELFRMVLTLESRGYIAQVSGKDGYGLTNKMFSLGVAQTPTRTLIESALPEMKELACDIGQSCHLVVASNDQIVVVARIESPRDLGFSVRVGYRRPLIESTSGAILCGMQSVEKRIEQLGRLDQSEGEESMNIFRKKIEFALANDFVRSPSDFVDGVTDLSSPILSAGTAIATLTIPYVKCNPELCSESEALEKLRDSTRRISENYVAEAG